MSRASVCVNFFKEHGIQHYRKPKHKNAIVFPCFECGGEAVMDTFDTSWHCNAGHTGTLATLIRMTEQGRIRPDGDLYNPIEEKELLLKGFDELVQQHGELRSELQGLRKRVQTLIDHYERRDR